MNPDEILAALREGRDADLIGLEESTTFDAKSEPYRMDDPKTRWELAKDVSAMANAEGGILLVGAKTKRLENSFVEQVDEIRPVPTRFVNEEQLRGALKNLVFPAIGNYVDLHRFDRGDDKTLLAIHVQKPPDDDLPALVTTRASVEVDGRSHEIEAFGLARRVGSGTEWDQGAKIWSDIRDGRLARRSLTLQGSQSQEPDDDRIRERLDQLLELVGADDHAYIALAAYPVEPLRINDFVSDSGVYGLLRSLPTDAVRPNGFGLGYGLDPQPVGPGLADIESGRRGLLVDPDGLTLAVALGTREMLGWAHRTWSGNLDDPLRINRHIIAEWPLEFTRFVMRVRELGAAVPWRWQASVRRLQTGRPPQVLHLGEEWYFDSDPPRVDEAEIDGDLLDAETAAYAIVRWLAGLFNASPERIPAVEDERVSPELIRAW